MKKNRLYLFLIVLTIAFVQYFKVYFVENIFYIFIGSFFAGVIITSFLLFGNRVLNSFNISAFSFFEKNIFSYALGAGFYMLIMFVLGILGLYNKIIIWLIILLPIIIEHKELFVIIRTIKEKLNGIFLYSWNYIFCIIFILTTFFLGITFLASFVPPTYYDSLVYHLALPSLYKNAGKIFFVPFNLYSHFPQNMEMIFLVGLYFGIDILPNILSFSFYFFTTGAIITFCNRFFNKKISLLSTFFFVTTPAVILLSPSSYVECGLAFYIFISLYLIIILMFDKKIFKDGIIKIVILSGFFSGISFGIKYTGIIVVIIINILFFIKFFREQDKIIFIKQVIYYNSFVFITFLPWFLKNIIYVGNPVFPFFYNIIGYKNIPWTQQTAAGYFKILTEYAHSEKIFYELILFPVKLIFTPEKFGGGADILGNYGWVIFFLFFPLYLFVKNKSKVVNVIIYSFIINFLIWFSFRPVLRFFYPMIILLSIIISYSIYNIFEQEKSYVINATISFIVLGFFILNFFIYYFIQDKIQIFRVVFGVVSREEYLTYILQNSPYKVFKFINKNLSDKDKIFFVGEQRGFYCEKNFVATNIFAPEMFIDLVNNSKNYTDLIDKLKDIGITYVMYNKNEGERLRGYGILNFSSGGENVWSEFLRYKIPEYQFREVYLYRL